MLSNDGQPNDGDGMDFDFGNFYWTTADTVSALVAAGGAMIGLSIDRIYRRLVAIKRGA
jgi:hypothetical protein